MRIPIAVKYASLVLAIILATSGLLSWFFLDLTHAELKQQLHKRGEAGTRQLAYLVAPLLLGKDEAKVGAALNHVLKDPDILGATVIDAEDIVVADKQPERAGRKFDDPDLPLPLLKGAGSREDDAHDLLTFFEPSQFGGVRVGGVVLQISQGSVRRALRDASTRVLTITGIIAGAVMALSFLMLRRTLKPLNQVLEGTRRISAGDFSARLEVRSGDEIGDLAEAFNGMAARTELFFRYLDKDIAERLSQDESLARPGGHLRAVSVLFGDMRGFTALSNQRSPSEVVSILNTYFEISSGWSITMPEWWTRPWATPSWPSSNRRTRPT